MAKLIEYPWTDLSVGEYLYRMPGWSEPEKVTIELGQGDFEGEMLVRNSEKFRPTSLRNVPAMATFERIPERVKIVSKEPANIILFNAICAVCQSSELLGKFNIKAAGDETVANVEVFVNGVPIPFMGVLDKAIQDILAKQNAAIKNEALKLLTHSPLRELQREIQDAEWKIRAALDAIAEPKE